MLTDIAGRFVAGVAPPYDQTGKEASLRHAARAFEAAFLAEMLRAAGAGRALESFGGGVGEEQFSSFLVDQQASRIADRGGIGLAEMILRRLLSESAGGPMDDARR